MGRGGGPGVLASVLVERLWGTSTCTPTAILVQNRFREHTNHGLVALDPAEAGIAEL